MALSTLAGWRQLASRVHPKAAPLRCAVPMSLPTVSVSALRSAKRPSVAYEGKAQERRFYREAPAFIDDPFGVVLFKRLSVKTYTSPPLLTVAIPNAELVGYRTLVHRGGFTTDETFIRAPDRKRYLAQLSSDNTFLNEETGLRPIGADAFRLDRAGRSERHLRGPHVVLCSHEPSNYGSFLFRVLPKTITATADHFRGLPVVAPVYNETMSRLLELAGIDRGQIVPHDVSVISKIDRAIAPVLRNPYGHLDTESHAMFQRIAAGLADDRERRWVYVSRMGQARRAASSRVLMNEEALIERLTARGVLIVEPEALPIDEQIRVFASAAGVIGPAGSGMFNVVFCRPGTPVIDIESERHWIFAHAGLFSSCGLPYGIVIGIPDPEDLADVHRRWRVDIEALERRLDAMGL